jgi:hypothetical protein
MTERQYVKFGAGLRTATALAAARGDTFLSTDAGYTLVDAWLHGDLNPRHVAQLTRIIAALRTRSNGGTRRRRSRR